jgi:8-oxo-dGTP diphosphatase
MSSPLWTVGEIDWLRWTPTERATLIFVIRGGRILLIRKKRGLGAGKINGPGGRIEQGESPEQCAIRELQEELRVVPLGVEHRGELSFQFTDGFSIHAHVFTATDSRGEPQETDEALPLWFSTTDIPYAEMWQDDALWLPLALAGKRFSGRFVFEGDRMLDADVRELP